MILAAYLSRLYATRLAAVLFALAGLMALVDLMERADAILDRGLGPGGMAWHALLRLPSMLDAAFPVAALAAPVLVLAVLAGRGEIPALRAAGMPVGHLILWLMPVALLAALAHLALADRLVPAAERLHAGWWGREATAPLWFRDGMDVVGVGAVAGDGSELGTVEILRRDPDGALAEWVLAERAEWADGRWALLDGTRQAPRGIVQRFDRLTWGSALAPANVVELTRADPALPLGRLVAALAGRWAVLLSPATLSTRLHHLLSQPLVPVLMLLLALPVARGTSRGGGIPAGMAMGLAAGLSYLLLDGILVALGEAGTLPPALAGWGAHGVFACIGGAFLVNAEG